MTILFLKSRTELGKKGQLMTFRHSGFWKCMDTLKDKLELQSIGIQEILLGKNGNGKMFNNIFQNKKVLVTGNAGFKGSWLTLWLLN